jgi:hypothetical protein
VEIRKTYLRRSMKRARLQQRVAVAALLAVTGCVAFLLHQQPRQPGQAAVTVAAPAAPMPAVLRVAAEAAPAEARRVYPYSIVPGGVTDRIELARAVMADRVVAAHYAGFAIDKASLRTVDKARAVYVSYRKGDQVYWTARKVMLNEGESVLSDGQNEIRARCGNRISDTPQLPVEVKGPDEHELDTPIAQAQDGGEGAVRTVAFGIDEQDGGGQRFMLPLIANGAGLLAAAQPQAGFSQASFSQVSLDRLFDSDRRLASLPVLWDLTGSAGTRPTASVPATGSTSTGDTTTGSSNGGTGDTATGGSGGSPTGSTTNSGSGDKPTGGDSGKLPSTPAPADPRTDPLPNGTIPAKSHDLPEPGGLWLTGVAAAALLLQRRLRSRRPR